MTQKNRSQQRTSPPRGDSAAKASKEPVGAMDAGESRRAARWGAAIWWCELGLCVAIAAYIATCHVAFAQHRGGLWRDEVQIVNLGLSPTFAEFWKDLAIDTFPALWPAVVRGWSWVCGASDGSLRLLGLEVGLSVLAAVWWNSWRLTRGFPLLTLVLFALCPTVICYGDALRGYGLGLAFLFLMYGAIWRAAAEPTPWRIAWGLLAALLAVQSMYFNAVILLALGAGSAMIALRRRKWSSLLVVVGIGLAAAVSLMPFTDPLSRQKQWHEIMSYDVGFSWIFGKFSEAVNTSGSLAIWVWLGIAAVAFAAVVYSAVRPSSRHRQSGDFDAGAFAAVVTVVGALGYLVFIFASKQPTNIWYYMPLMAFLSVGFDAAFEGGVLSGRMGRIARLVCAAVLFALIVPAAWHLSQVRMTNIDQVANVLAEKAQKEDQIVVAPWWPGVSFARYYRGAAPWTTLPDLGPLRVQRYDVFKQRMAEAEPIRPVLERIAATLRAGHRVWVVGGLATMPPDAPPRNVPPIPQGPMNEGPYLTVWSEQMTYLLMHHSQHGEVVPIDARGEVSDMECPNLIWFEGWR